MVTSQNIAANRGRAGVCPQTESNRGVTAPQILPNRFNSTSAPGPGSAVRPELNSISQPKFHSPEVRQT